MTVLSVLPLLMGAVLAGEIVFFGLIRPRLRQGFLLSAASGLGMVVAWGASLHGSLVGAVAAAMLAGVAHGVDLWRRGRG